jgi:hypothetical protein
MRAKPFKIGSDAVHIYSDAQRIWLQLRRKVPTEHSIAKPSFKVALSLTSELATAIASELLTAARRKAAAQSGGKLQPGGKQRHKPKSPPTTAA